MMQLYMYIPNIKSQSLVVSDKKVFFWIFFPYKSLYHVKCDSGRDYFWPQVHNLNKLSRLECCYISNIKALSLVVLWFKTGRLFSSFPDISLCKTCDPSMVGAIFGLRSIF